MSLAIVFSNERVYYTINPRFSLWVQQPKTILILNGQEIEFKRAKPEINVYFYHDQIWTDYPGEYKLWPGNVKPDEIFKGKLDDSRLSQNN